MLVSRFHIIFSNVKAIQKLNETELNLGVRSASKSWHDMYSGSAYVFIGILSVVETGVLI